MATQEFYIRNENETEARGLSISSSSPPSSTPASSPRDPLLRGHHRAMGRDRKASAEIKAASFPRKRSSSSRRRKTSRPQLPAADSRQRPSPLTTCWPPPRAAPTTPPTNATPPLPWPAPPPSAPGARSSMLVIAAAPARSCPRLISCWPSIRPMGLLDRIPSSSRRARPRPRPPARLGMVTLYPLVRFRAALGLGFLGFLFYTQGLNLPLLAVCAGLAGLYLCTVSVSLISGLFAGLLGLLPAWPGIRPTSCWPDPSRSPCPVWPNAGISWSFSAPREIWQSRPPEGRSLRGAHFYACLRVISITLTGLEDNKAFSRPPP
jgi:hypothetical protein